MSEISFYDTLNRKLREFSPLHGNDVGVYSCGPTVYDYAHIGNLRAFLFADLLKRTLLSRGYKVKHIMNITDVGHLTGDRDMGEDKVESAARKKNMTAWEIASFYTDAFLRDAKTLNILLADKYPKATGHIKDMIALIGDLEEKGYAYRTGDGIYFDTSKLSDYGKLARLDIEGLREGARVEKNPQKRNPTDFALWKFSNPNASSDHSAGDNALASKQTHVAKREMEWDSPWGIGFPGWHIECSAMSARYLGQPFDIHTGGVDHIPVHHTNELAQSEAGAQKPLANFWMHSEHVMVNNRRMGKSEGNLITLDQLAEKGYLPLAYRYFVLQGHYRSKLNFTWEALGGAQNALLNIYSIVASATKPGAGSVEHEESFFEAIYHDLDTPQALSVMWEMLRSPIAPEDKLQSVLKFDNILGLAIEAVWQEQKNLSGEVLKLMDQRERLRAEKNFIEADKIREDLGKRGFEVRDTESGQFVRKIQI